MQASLSSIRNGSPATSGFPDPVRHSQWSVFVLKQARTRIRGARVNEISGQRLTNTDNAVLHALDARPAKNSTNSGSAMETWVHFSGLAIAQGSIFAVDYDSNVYCFGLKASQRSRRRDAGFPQ